MSISVSILGIFQEPSEQRSFLYERFLYFKLRNLIED